MTEEPILTVSKEWAEAILGATQKRFRSTLDTMPALIWMSGLDKLCTYVNQRWLDFTGRSLEEELGSGWAEAIHPEDLRQFMDTYAKAFDRRELFNVEGRFCCRDGEYCWLLAFGAPRFNPDGSFAGYIGTAFDVTKHKLAEEAFSKVSQRFIEAQDEECHWIARELHDDFAQRFALLAMHLDICLRLAPQSMAELREKIAQAQTQVSELADDLRGLAHHLHPSKLEYLKVAEVADDFCRVFSNRHGVEIDFHSQSIPEDLPQDISLCLFRILQEALQNAVKHSGSRQFYVSLSGRSNEIGLTVRDSGIGFEPDEVTKGPGLGLTSMKERLKFVKGTLSIESHLQRGTTIYASVPLRHGEQSAQAG